MDRAAQPTYDAIIVGSGPGGATVARELTRAGKRVCILEWGPGDPLRGTASQSISQMLVPGKSLLFAPGLVAMVRGITLGGSSVFYYATAFPVPFDMLAAHGVDIREDVAAARAELPIAPLREEMITPMARRIMQSARACGFDWKPLAKLMYQDRWRPEMPFGHFGDPHGVKWSSRNYVEEAIEQGASLVDRARVTRVLVEGETATGVEYWRGGRRVRVSAERIVLAAGGIGSPVILRASGIPEAGNDFFFDPLVAVSGRVQGLAAQANEIPMTAGVHLAEEGYIMTDMAVPFLNHLAFAASGARIDKLGGFRTTARIMVKVRDRLGGRLTDGGGVRKALHADDRAKLHLGASNAKRILEEMGARGIHRSGVLAAHPGGTVKLGELVDDRLQTRLRHLHVCDCSVIPEAWGLPPTLTIVGLGRYLARKLTAATAKDAQPAQAARTAGRGL